MSDEPHTYRTKSGRVLTNADIEALADEAEQGYDVEHLAKKTGRPRMGSAPAEVVPDRRVPPVTLDGMKLRREPIRPEGAPRLGETYVDWRDFTNRVARPWLDNDGEDQKTDAWCHTLMLERDPWYIACALVMADNTIRALEAKVAAQGAVIDAAVALVVALSDPTIRNIEPEVDAIIAAVDALPKEPTDG